MDESKVNKVGKVVMFLLGFSSPQLMNILTLDYLRLRFHDNLLRNNRLSRIITNLHYSSSTFFLIGIISTTLLIILWEGYDNYKHSITIVTNISITTSLTVITYYYLIADEYGDLSPYFRASVFTMLIIGMNMIASVYLKYRDISFFIFGYWLCDPFNYSLNIILARLLNDEMELDWGLQYNTPIQLLSLCAISSTSTILWIQMCFLDQTIISDVTSSSHAIATYVGTPSNSVIISKEMINDNIKKSGNNDENFPVKKITYYGDSTPLYDDEDYAIDDITQDSSEDIYIYQESTTSYKSSSTGEDNVSTIIKGSSLWYDIQKSASPISMPAASTLIYIYYPIIIPYYVIDYNTANNIHLFAMIFNILPALSYFIKSLLGEGSNVNWNNTKWNLTWILIIPILFLDIIPVICVHYENSFITEIMFENYILCFTICISLTYHTILFTVGLNGCGYQVESNNQNKLIIITLALYYIASTIFSTLADSHIALLRSFSRRVLPTEGMNIITSALLWIKYTIVLTINNFRNISLRYDIINLGQHYD